MPVTLSEHAMDMTRSGARITSCGYIRTALDAPIVTVNLTIDAAVDASGVSWVEDAFTGVTMIDPNATAVPGYGDRALWSQETGQLIVMVDSMWLSFMVGEGIKLQLVEA